MGRLKQVRLGPSPLTPRVAYLDNDRESARRAVAPWRTWYSTARWARLRAQVLREALFTCVRCGHGTADTSRLVCDHVEPHRGRAALFWDRANLQCLCKPCHDGAKQREEAAARLTGGAR